MIKADYHMHTDFSSDSKAKMEDMIKKSIELGFKEIAFTDHIEYDGTDDIAYRNNVSFGDYIINFNNLKEKYSKKINLVLGVELGLGCRFKEDIIKFTEKYPVEFVIGSCHTINGLDIYSNTNLLFENKTKKEIYKLYLDEIMYNVKNFECFNVVGHFDYIIRRANFDNNNLYTGDFEDYIIEIFKEIIYRGKGIEINTSGFKYNLNNPHPAKEMIKKYKELGGEIITIGSDAHAVNNIGQMFNDAEEILKNVGFKGSYSFKDKKAVWISF